MNKLQWEQHMLEQAAALQNRIDRYELTKITKALARSRRQAPNNPVQQAPLQVAQRMPAQPPVGHHVPAQPAMRENAPLQQQVAQQVANDPKTHVRPDEPTRPRAPVAAPATIADNQIDLTELSDGEDAKLLRRENPPVDSTPTLRRTQSPLPVRAAAQLPVTNEKAAQQSAQPPSGVQPGNHPAAQNMNAVQRPVRPFFEAQPLAVQKAVKTQQLAHSPLGVQHRCQCPHHATKTCSHQSSNKTQPTKEKITPPDDMPYKEELPNVVRNPDGDGYVELRCPICGGNSSARHNSNGQLKLFVGAIGILSHYRICHPGSIQAGQTFTLQNIVRLCTYRTLTEGEIQAMLAKTAGSYAIGHFRAAVSEEGAKIKAPRERKPKQAVVPTKASGRKRSRPTGKTTKQLPAKKSRPLSGSNFFVPRNVEGEVNDDDDEDDDLPTKKHRRMI